VGLNTTYAFLGSRNIVAFTGTEEPGSVSLELSGPMNITRTDNEAPFTVLGESNGILESVSFPEGEYTLTATPYSEQDPLFLVKMARNGKCKNLVVVIQVL